MIDQIGELLQHALPYATLGLAVLLLRGRRAKPAPPNPNAATCGCDHDYAVHDVETGRCNAEILREHYQNHGTRNGWEWVKCPCKNYSGPKPIDTLFQPRLQLPPSKDQQ